MTSKRRVSDLDENAMKAAGLLKNSLGYYCSAGREQAQRAPNARRATRPHRRAANDGQRSSEKPLR